MGNLKEGEGKTRGRQGTHVVSWGGAAEVERRLERDGGVRDESRDAEVVLGRGVWLRCGVSGMPLGRDGDEDGGLMLTMKGCRRTTSPASPVSCPYIDK